MTEYWKSQAKKFCDFCKCWIADNKASVEFHEKGKRHKENVTKRIKSITQQSQKDYKGKLKIDEEMKKIEKAALQAYMKDVESNADFTSLLLNEQLNRETATQSTDDAGSSSKTEGDETRKETTGSCLKWYEAVSEEGYTYYWNTETDESVWEPPEEGYMSLGDQKKLEGEEIEQETETVAEEEKKNADIANMKTKEGRKKAEISKTKVEEGRRKAEMDMQAEEEKKNTEMAKMKAEECRAFIAREKMKKLAKEDDCATKLNEAHKEKFPIIQTQNYNPYGKWTTVKISPQEPVDLELPGQETEVTPVQSKEPKMKFKEKTIAQLDTDETSEINFKRRKINIKSNRNMRQRLGD